MTEKIRGTFLTKVMEKTIDFPFFCSLMLSKHKCRWLLEFLIRSDMEKHLQLVKKVSKRLKGNFQLF